ncbi:hypothetical protein J2767_000164 [Agrobacterium tumefaciens]|uniref:hypothetical protein n=1 Tax=Agrobacterium tumefaciens TaxID=358 RepID=UPI000DD5E13B|nr:hypothetical protein [Agrobacterium tumefaciens]MBP2569020.1 hypothetical protein [Agrobacterium tumefaciens]
MAKQPNVDDVQRDLLIRIRTEGVRAAYEASLAVCSDVKAPAPARATASATLFRVAGYFDKQERDNAKEPHEMTSEELNAEIARLARQSATTATDDPDVFD